MSFDPFNEPGRPSRDDSRPAPAAPSQSAARGRLTIPAILMMVLTGVNFILGTFTLLSALNLASISDEQYAAQQEQANQVMAKMFGLNNAQPAGDPVAMKRISIIASHVIAWPNILLAPLVVFGAINMLRARGYGMAVFASIVSMIPVVSCMGCCGLGEAVGIWSLVVLLQGDVKAAFR